MTCGIYSITNLKTGKVYIGQSKNIERRWKQHITRATNYLGGDYFNKFYTDIRVLGVKNFKFEILEKLEYNKDVLNAREQYWIEYYDALKTGYNIIPSNNNSSFEGKIIIIEDINTKEKYKFSSFEVLLKWLKKKHITNSINLDYYFTRCIKNKIPVFNRWYIYYGKEKKND